MRIGVLKEIKVGERRVVLLPGAVRRLADDGHEILVEHGAGVGAGAPDETYLEVGARIVERSAVFEDAELICKVKEPLAEERSLLQPHHLLFAYLHLAADGRLTNELISSGSTCLAFETLTGPDGTLPLLEPMSEIAGRLAILMGQQDLLERSGRLVGRVTGVPASRVVILGCGTVGLAAAEVALGLGADVVMLDVQRSKLEHALVKLDNRISVYLNTDDFLEQALEGASLVVGAALSRGARAPKILTRAHLRLLADGAVFVDVAIDQGGCAETSRPTTLEVPTYETDRVIHRCVTNMPGSVPETASAALSAAVLPYVRRVATISESALMTDPVLVSGINVWRGELVQPEVAEAHDLPLGTLNGAVHRQN